jgi:ribosomal protein S18 acetylase RimI-like enzyme
MGVSYREAGEADVEQLARIRAIEWGSEQYWRERILGYLTGTLNPQRALAQRVVLVAAQDTRIVGFIAGHLTRRYDCDGEVEWINVIPEERRTGVAAELLRLLASWFAGQQARRICVDVDPENAPARAFYRRHGAQDLNPHWLAWPDITLLVAGPEPAQ